MISLLSLELTERCNIRCPHCIVECEPGTGRDMALRLVTKAVEAAAGHRIPLLSVSGGEPMLAREQLDLLLSEAKRAHLPVRLVTNASWAVTVRKTRQLLENLVTKGLTRLSVSADPYHQTAVPMENVRRIAFISKEMPLRVELNIVLSRDNATLSILEEIADWEIPLAITPLARQGRARSLNGNLFFSPEPFFGCPVVYSPGIDVEGSINICCNMSGSYWRSKRPNWPFRLGNLEDNALDAIRTHDNPFTKRIVKWGPLLLAGLASSRIGYARIKFASPCEACLLMATDKKFLEAARMLSDEELNDAVKWDRYLDDNAQIGNFQIAFDAKIISFPLSSHLNESLDSERGHLLTFTSEDGKREFILLDTVSANEVGEWINSAGLNGTIEFTKKAEDLPVPELFRYRMLRSLLNESGFFRNF